MNMFSACSSSSEASMITCHSGCWLHQLKIASKNVSEWCFMTSPHPFYLPSYKIYYINFMCFHHLREMLSSSSSSSLLLLLVLLRCDGSCSRRQTIFSHEIAPLTSSSTLLSLHFFFFLFFWCCWREIWCIMYVNDTTFRLTLYCILMKWHATRKTYLYEKNLNLLVP